MLFNSYIFILVFLPLVIFGFHFIGSVSNHRVAIAWLVGSSLFFYGWWNPSYLGLIIGSILFNYAIGAYLGKHPSRAVLTAGIVVNLSALSYFKYANFFIDSLNAFADINIHLHQIVLPLAISFFTFQQIAYLVDAYRGIAKEYNFLHYCLFVTFFPQLIAGPIVRHNDMLPQFANSKIYKLNTTNLSIGLTIFTLGLFKKVILADSIAVYATPVFVAAENGVALTFYEAWIGAFAYSFQLYFDFSGYSDMAVGAARMLNVVLPINFFSPYKSDSIIEFWRRWHISLSSFLRDYLYIPLGGSRRGTPIRYANVLVTMLLGGLWHGAGWTFILWGGIHGLYLVINLIWRCVPIFNNSNAKGLSLFFNLTGFAVTFICVVIAWVMFRAESFDGAINFYSSMLGFKGIMLPSFSDVMSGIPNSVVEEMFRNSIVVDPKNAGIFIVLMFIVVWFLPNTFELLKNHNPVLGLDRISPHKRSWFNWQFNTISAYLLALVTLVCLINLSAPSEFLYFQF